MPFADLQEFFDPTLRLPIRGKEYVIASPDARTGLWCQRLLVTATSAVAGVEVTAADLAGLELDDDQEQDLYLRLLGPVFEQMQADGLPWEMIKHAGQTVFMWVAGGREAAEEVWSQPPGEAKGPSPRSASATKKSDPRGSRAGSKTTAAQEDLEAEQAALITSPTSS